MLSRGRFARCLKLEYRRFAQLAAVHLRRVMLDNLVRLASDRRHLGNRASGAGRRPAIISRSKAATERSQYSAARVRLSIRGHAFTLPPSNR